MIIWATYHLAKLRRNVWRSPAELETIQVCKLRALVQHAYEHVPYYRHLFDQVGLSPGDIRSLDDLRALPVTTKAALREHPEQARVTPHRDGRNYISETTSGSTGMPFQIHFSRQEHRLRSLNIIRALIETGYRLTDRQALIRHERDEAQSRWWFQNLGIFRKYYVCVFDDLDVQLAKLRQIRPQHIYGFPSALKCLAQALLEEGITEVRPRVVCTSAEVLDEGTREIIRRGFDAPVLDLYGSVEFGNVAWECPTGAGYHISSDLVLVEFLVDGRPAQPGERAELVCTSLFGYTMPFIRYSLGDVAAPLAGACPCGRGLPLMGPVEGRLVDLIVLPSGRKISPYQFTTTVELLPGIRQYQVIQETTTRILVRIVPGAGFSPGTLAEVEARCYRIVAQEAQVSAEVTESLPLEPSGKFRVVKSKVRQGT